MKKFTAVILILISVNVHSQSLVDSLANPRFTLEDSIAEALADLALESTDIKVIETQIEASKQEWKTNKFSLLNNVSANFNMNEGNFKSSSDPAFNYFYPRYNFSLNLPLGNLITRPAQAKKARAQYDETIYRRQAAIRDLRVAILSAYQDYKMYKYQLGVQDIVIQDETESFNQAEQRFRNNQLTMEGFTAASKRLNDQLVARITTLRNLNVAKYNLEALIGRKLEDALAHIALRRQE